MNCLVCADDIKDTFYASLDNVGNLETYCFRCYSKNVLDNYPDMIAAPIKVKENGCECGKEKHGFASHSNWCGRA